MYIRKDFDCGQRIRNYEINLGQDNYDIPSQGMMRKSQEKYTKCSLVVVNQ